MVYLEDGATLLRPFHPDQPQAAPSTLKVALSEWTRLSECQRKAAILLLPDSGEDRRALVLCGDAIEDLAARLTE